MRIIFVIGFIGWLLNNCIAQAPDKIVAKDGSGDFTTVQEAINAAPSNSTLSFVILIKNGIYKEKINIPSNKTFLVLKGESVAYTILTFDDFSGKPMPGGGTYGTSNSASVTVNAADFTAIDLTFENTTGDAPQALAINVNANRAAFKNCRFLGGQDTLLTNGHGNKQYYRNCYIDGVVDFIFGGARAVFDSCFVYAKSRKDGLGGSYITAANTQADQPYGYVFRNCILPSNTGVTKYVLGRPWQNSSSTNASTRSFPKVVFINSVFGSNQIKPEGWSVWDAGTVTDSIYYAEYKSKKFNGSLIDVSKRVSWSYQLGDNEVLEYADTNLFETWSPCDVAPGFCDSRSADIVVSNFKAVKGQTKSTLSWNITWPSSNIKFEIYRSDDNSIFNKISDLTASNDSLVNFQYEEAIPAPGEKYFYYIEAKKTGLETHRTKTLEISSASQIFIDGGLNEFQQGLGLPSLVQEYALRGENLTAAISINPPDKFEISIDGINWHVFGNPLTINQVNSGVAPTKIKVRLNSSSIGNVTGHLVHSSTGAPSLNITVTGIVLEDPLPVSKVLAYWPFTQSNQDDIAFRSNGVEVQEPKLERLYISNGTTVAAVPSYSDKFGKAFGPGNSGDALWTTTSGGPGGNLNRLFYHQYVIKASDGFDVKVDSVALKASYYNTSSNTKMALVYSKSGFTDSDSLDVTGGVGPDGLTFSSNANGAFATPVFLNNETSGTTARYSFALNGADGVFLSSSDSLTLRIYNSCGSTSLGRYLKVKDLYFKGSVNEEELVTSIDKKLNYTISPNPIRSSITIHCSRSVYSSIKIYSVTGILQKHLESDFVSGSIQVEAESLSSGMYLVECRNSQGKIVLRMIKL